MGWLRSFHDLEVMPGLGKSNPARDGEIFGEKRKLARSWKTQWTPGTDQSLEDSRSLGPEIPSSEFCQENHSTVQGGKKKGNCLIPNILVVIAFWGYARVESKGM